MTNQDRELATADLIWSLRHIAELKGHLDSYNMLTPELRMNLSSSLDYMKSAIQLINRIREPDKGKK